MSPTELAARLESQGAWVSPDLRVSEQTAADIVGVKFGTLRAWRYSGVGPTFIYAGRVTYRIASVLDFIKSHEMQNHQGALTRTNSHELVPASLNQKKDGAIINGTQTQGEQHT